MSEMEMMLEARKRQEQQEAQERAEQREEQEWQEAQKAQGESFGGLALERELVSSEEGHPQKIKTYKYYVIDWETQERLTEPLQDSPDHYRGVGFTIEGLDKANSKLTSLLNEKREEAKREAEHRRNLQRLGVLRTTLPYTGANLSTFEPQGKKLKSALRSANYYATEFDRQLQVLARICFCGPTGSGKTRIACALAETLTEAGYRVAYITAADLLRVFYGLKGSKTELYANSLLIVDSLGLPAKDKRDDSADLLSVLTCKEMRSALAEYRESGRPSNAGRVSLIIADCDRKSAAEYLGEDETGYMFNEFEG